MRVPIAHCLGYPARLETSARRLDLATIARLDFEAPDFDRFPALKLAILAMRSGGAMSTVLNAANEIAVEAFLSGQLSFSGIPRLVENVMERLSRHNSDDAPDTVACSM
jgi:1-deoxy-D-xylulose-5-phosphate reductoisomerase